MGDVGTRFLKGRRMNGAKKVTCLGSIVSYEGSVRVVDCFSKPR